MPTPGVKLRAEVLLDFRKRMLAWTGRAGRRGRSSSRHSCRPRSESGRRAGYCPGRSRSSRFRPRARGGIRPPAIRPGRTESDRGGALRAADGDALLAIPLRRASPGLRKTDAVDGDLPEVVEAAGPAQPRHVDGREAEPPGELLDVVRNSSRMTEGRVHRAHRSGWRRSRAREPSRGAEERASRMPGRRQGRAGRARRPPRGRTKRTARMRRRAPPRPRPSGGRPSSRRGPAATAKSPRGRPRRRS